MATTRKAPARRKTSSAAKPDVYQVVTDRIVAQLEAGTAPWRKPWNTTVGRPQNLDGRPYRGINILLLGLSDHTSPFWLTFKQAQERGGNVRKGEKGTLIVFWKTLRISEVDEATGQKVSKVIPLLRYFYVFNLEQTEGVKVPKRVRDWEAGQENHEHEPLLSAEEVIAGYRANGGPEIQENGTEAFYRPAADVITLPPRATFPNGDEFYSTLFHEIAHSTGHESRLNRKQDNGFGSHEYGREELVAEMTSAFLQAETGVEGAFDNSAAYLQSWISTIKEDVRAVVVAAGAAQRATDLVLGRTAEVAAEAVETPAQTSETVHHSAA